MKKILSIFLIGFIAVGILIPTHFVIAQTDADMGNFAGSLTWKAVADIFDYGTGITLGTPLKGISVLILTFSL
jgi:hypothetical protein